MGCTNEKEYKSQAKERGCLVMDSNFSSSNRKPRYQVNSPKKQQYIDDVKDHYYHSSIKSDVDENSTIFSKRHTPVKFKESQSLIQPQECQSIDQNLLIGQYLQIDGIEDEIQERRTKSFNPDEKWKKQVRKNEGKPDQQEMDHQFLLEFLNESFKKSHKKYDNKLRRGPLQVFRWESWKVKLLNDEQYKQYFHFKVPNLYEYLLSPFVSKNQDSFYETNMHLIKKDVTRTFPEWKFFENEEMGQNQLKRTLFATSNLFRQVGYCQGMNFIMGMLLLVSGADESSVFECFISLSFRPEYMLVGLFETGFPLLRFLEFAFEDIFRTHLPNLYQHFQQEEILNTAWITKWLMTLYLYSFPLSKCIRIMDYIISSNIFAMIYVAAQILINFEQELLKMDCVEIITFFSRRQSQIGDNEQPENKQITLDQVDIEQVIKNAPKLALPDKQIRQLAIQCKAFIADEYSALVNKVNKNEKDHESFMVNYAVEVSNITFFIHYYTLQGLNEQSEYLNKIKYKYINQEIVDKH